MSNFETVKDIAETLEAIANGDAWICPHCGEITTGDMCINWGCASAGIEAEQATMYDWVIAHSLDVDFRVRLGYREVIVLGVRHCVTLGGPSVYVDTYERKVEIYWGGEHESYPISSTVCDALDEIAQETIDINIGY